MEQTQILPPAANDQTRRKSARARVFLSLRTTRIIRMRTSRSSRVPTSTRMQGKRTRSLSWEGPEKKTTVEHAARQNHVRLPVRASFRYKEAHGSFGSIRRFNPDLVVRNRSVDKTTRKGFSRSGAGRVLVLRRREGTPRGRRARAVREVRRRGDGDRGERPFGGDAERARQFAGAGKGSRTEL